MYVLILVVPFLRNFFELYPLDLIDYLGIGLVALIWALVVRLPGESDRVIAFLELRSVRFK